MSTYSNQLVINSNVKFEPPVSQERSYPPVNLTSAITSVTSQSYGNGTWKVEASSETAGREAYTAFSGRWQNGGHRFDSSTGYYRIGNSLQGIDYNGEYLKISMPVSLRLLSYKFATHTVLDRIPKSWKMYGRKGQVYPWIELDTRTGQSLPINTETIFTLTPPSPEYYTEFALVIGQVIGGSTGTSYLNLVNLKLSGIQRFQDNAIEVNGPVTINDTIRGNDIVPLSGTFNLWGSLDVDGTLLAKMIGGCVNVKAFNAIGDGSTDDTSAISLALSSLVSIGGGTLYFPKGTYLVDSVYIQSNNIRIIGDGVGNSIIRGKNGGAVSMAYASNILIKDIEIDGNRRTPGTVGHGIRCAGGNNIQIRNVKINNSPDYGIGFQDYNLYERIILDNVHIIDSGGDGIDFKNRDNCNFNIVMNNILVENWCASGSGSGAAIDIRGPALMTNIVLRRNINTFEAINVCVGIRFRAGEIGDPNGVGGHYSKLSNFQIDISGFMIQAGVNPEGNRISICNGFVRGCNFGVHIEQESVSISNVSFVGCNICVYATTINSPGYAYTVPSNYAMISNVSCEQSITGIELPTNHCVVTGCILRNLVTGLKLTGSGIVQANNVFVNNTTNILYA